MTDWKQAVIDEIEERKNANGYHNVAVISEFNRLEGYIMQLPSAQPEQQWIPCSERLPEEDGLYLVTTSKEQVQTHVFSRNGNSEEYQMRCNKAWMPMPEPWRGEE